MHFKNLRDRWKGKRALVVASRTWQGKGRRYGDSGEYIAWDHVLPFMGVESCWLPLELLSRNPASFYSALSEGGSQADLVLLWLPGRTLDFQALAGLRERQGKTRIALMCSQDQTHFNESTRPWLPWVDYCLSTDAASLPKYETAGFPRAHLTQWAVNPFRYIDLCHPRHFSWCFPGHVYGVRGLLLEYLKNNIPGGAGCSTPPGDGFIRLMQDSHVVINFSSSPAAGPLRRIKNRVFEPQILGAVLSTEYAPGLEDCWDLEEEIVCWTDVEECVEKTQRLLKDPARKEKMAERALNRCLEEHTWVHRFDRFFSNIWS